MKTNFMKWWRQLDLFLLKEKMKHCFLTNFPLILTNIIDKASLHIWGWTIYQGELSIIEAVILQYTRVSFWWVVSAGGEDEMLRVVMQHLVSLSAWSLAWLSCRGEWQLHLSIQYWHASMQQTIHNTDTRLCDWTWTAGLHSMTECICTFL